VEARHFLSDVHGFEKGFGAAEALAAHGNYLTVREFISSVILVGVFVSFKLSLVVEGDVAEFLLDISDGFALGR